MSQTSSNQLVSVTTAVAKMLSLIFNEGHWQGGYGGKAWGTVAHCLLNLVTGAYTPEMFCDVGFTLAHNGGPIYNKGIILNTSLRSCAEGCA